MPRSTRGAHVAASWLPLPQLTSGRARHARVLPGRLPALLLATTAGGLAALSVGPGPVAPELAVLAQQAAAPSALPDRSQVGQPVMRDVPDRASRSRRAPEPEPAPSPAEAAPVPVAAPVLAGCDAAVAQHSDDHANGRLPAAVLCALPGVPDERLRADAAIAFVGLAAAYQEHFGSPICVTDGYRTLGEQQQLRRTKPRLAARPGYSEHGWGLALDLSCGAQSFRTAQHRWLQDNAERFGWSLPAWARRDGSRPEPWHWEYAGG